MGRYKSKFEQTTTKISENNIISKLKNIVKIVKIKTNNSFINIIIQIINSANFK